MVSHITVCTAFGLYGKAILFEANLSKNLWISSDGQDGPAAGLGFYPTDSERKVLNFARECKKLNEQIAATSVCCDAGVKSKLVKRLEQVEKQIRMLNLL